MLVVCEGEVMSVLPLADWKALNNGNMFLLSILGIVEDQLETVGESLLERLTPFWL